MNDALLFLAVVAGLTVLAVAALALIARLARRGDDQRTRNDRAAARRICRLNPPAERQAPGTDHDLLLDAHLAYHGPAHATRKETNP